MSLSTAELQALSRLLDAGLALPEAEREAWLTALPEPDQTLAPRLRRLLAEQARPSPAHRLDEPPPLGPLPWGGEPGQRFGPYRLVAPLGRGGMGEVWRAERADGAFERSVALKLPRLRLWLAQDLAARLRFECQAVARLEHAHIARLYDGGVDEQGRPWIATELVDGAILDAHLRGQPLRERLRLLLGVVRAVAYAHERGVLHRDLKPSNVLVAADGGPRLVDFGIAALLGQPAADAPRALTPRYAAPELRSGAADDVRADVYSLGVMASELLADPPPARDLAAVLARATAADPQARYPSAATLADELDRCLRGEPVQARPLGRAARGARWLERHRLAAASLAIVALAGCAGLLLQQRAAQAAERERQAHAFIAELFRISLPEPGSQALLDRGARLIATRFADQPEQQLRLFALAADAYRDLGDHRQALALQEQRWRALPADAPPAERQAAALALAAAQLAEGRPRDAQQTLAPHAAAADPAARLLRARLHLELGEFESLKALLQGLDERLPAAGRERAQWLAVQAEVQQRDGRQDAALAGFAAAADLAERAGDPVLAATQRARGAHWAAQAGRVDAARTLHERSEQALRGLGGLYLVRAALDTVSYWTQLRVQPSVPYADADAGITQALAELRALGPAVPPRLLAGAEQELGTRRFVHGDLAGGVPLLWDASQRLAADEQRPLQRSFHLSYLALVDSLFGRHEDADRRLAQALADREAAGRGQHPYVVNLIRQRAFNASMAGWHARALAVLDAAPTDQALRAAGHDPAWYRSVLIKSRARVLLDAGDADGALALLAGQQPHRYDRELVGLAVGRDWLRGEALCQQGRAREGLALLQAQWRQLNPDYHAGHPGVARLRAVTAACAWRAGQHGTARALAAQARAALARPDGLSPYHLAPLVGLFRPDA